MTWNLLISGSNRSQAPSVLSLATKREIMNVEAYAIGGHGDFHESRINFLPAAKLGVAQINCKSATPSEWGVQYIAVIAYVLNRQELRRHTVCFQFQRIYESPHNFRPV